MSPPDSNRSPDPVIDNGHPAEDLWMAGVGSLNLDEFSTDPNYTSLLALLAQYGNTLKQRGVTSIDAANRSHFNGEGVLRIAREDFTREGLLALLGVTETEGSDDNCDGPAVTEVAPAVSSKVVQPRQSAAAPTAAHQTERLYRSRLLSVLRSVFPLHTANSLAASMSEDAGRQLEQETQAAQSKRDAIAAWFAQKRLGAGAVAKPTDKFHTRFNFFRPDGTYSGYSLRISSLPPFLMTYIKATQVDGRWETKVVLQDKSYEEVCRTLGV